MLLVDNIYLPPPNMVVYCDDGAKYGDKYNISKVVFYYG